MADELNGDAPLLKAVADVINARLGPIHQRLNDLGPAVRDVTINAQDLPAPRVTVHNDVRTPEVRVTNDVPAPVVHVTVDTAPLAAALDRMTARMEARDEMLGRLLQVLANRPAPQVVAHPAVEVNVPPVPVTVEAPAVTIQPPPPRHEKRSLTIKHDDGTTSHVYED